MFQAFMVDRAPAVTATSFKDVPKMPRGLLSEGFRTSLLRCTYLNQWEPVPSLGGNRKPHSFMWQDLTYEPAA